MWHQAVRYVRLGPTSTQRIHPLGPGLVKGIKTVQLTVKDAATASLVFGGFIDLQGYGQHDCIIKLRIFYSLCGIDGIKGHRRVTLIQLVTYIAVSIMLIQDILLIPGFVGGLENNFLHPVPVSDNLNPLPWIPLQDWILTDGRVNRDLEGAVPDVQDLLQGLLQLASELIILCNVLPQLPLLVVTCKIKIIHVIQDNA